MLSIRRNPDRTLTITLALFRWRLAVHILDVEFWTPDKCQRNVSYMSGHYRHAWYNGRITHKGE